MRILVVTLDVMLGDQRHPKYFRTVDFQVRKNILTGEFTFSEEQLKEFVYEKYPSLKDKQWYVAIDRTRYITTN